MNKKSKLNQHQWEKVLSIILLGVARDQEESSLMEDVEAVAKVEEDDSKLTILIRRKIEGITVRHIHLYTGSTFPADTHFSTL